MFSICATALILARYRGRMNWFLITYARSSIDGNWDIIDTLFHDSNTYACKALCRVFDDTKKVDSYFVMSWVLFALMYNILICHTNIIQI